MAEKKGDNVSVSVRIRPLNASEDEEAWKVEGSTLWAPGLGNEKKYTLNHVFPPTATTQDVYDSTTKGLVQQVMQGFNCTVFAYGQTSSGKTHTMRGTDESPGIIDQAVADIFQFVQQHEQERDFSLRVSYMELYKEEVSDLLRDDTTGHPASNLTVREDATGKVEVPGLSEWIVLKPEDIMTLMRRGDAKRKIASTNMNKQSSRSHAIFQMTIESKDRVQPPAGEAAAADADSRTVDPNSEFSVRVGILNLVDLAGSERVSKSGATGERLNEANNINKGLLQLGIVVKQLSEGDAHVPYRNSKLTFILKPSLGGNAKTAIICNMSPALVHRQDTCGTLQFATRAKQLKNEAVLNETLSNDALLKRQANQIEQLMREAAASGRENVTQALAELQQQLLDRETQLQQAQLATKEARSEAAEAVNRARFYEDSYTQAKEVTHRSGPIKRDARRRGTIHFGNSDGAQASLAKLLRDRDHLPAALLAPVSPIAEAAMDGGESSEENSDGDDQDDCADDDGPSSSKKQRTASMAAEASDEGQDDESQRRASHHVAQDANPVTKAAQRQSSNTAAVQATDAAQGARLPDFNGPLLAKLTALKAEVVERDAEIARQESALVQLDEERDRQVAELSDAHSAAQQAMDERQEQLRVALEQERWTVRQRDSALAQLRTAQEQAIEERSTLEAQWEARSAKEAQAAQRAAKDADASAAAAAALRQELSELRDEQEKLVQACNTQEGEKTMLKERDAKRLKEMETAKAQLKAAREEVTAAEARSTAAAEESAASKKELLAASSDIESLKKHCTDLESRKRAPLYQKKQEEELQSFKDKAAECEKRCDEAEAASKAARTQLQAVQQELETARENGESAATRQTEALEEQRFNARCDLEAAQQRAAKALAHLQKQHDELEKLQDSTQDAADNLANALAEERERAAGAQRKLQDELADAVEAKEASATLLDENAEAMAVMSKHIVELQEEVEQLKAGLASAEAAGVAAQQAHASEAAALKAGAEQRYSALENALQTQVAELKAARDAVECAADESSRLAAEAHASAVTQLVDEHTQAAAAAQEESQQAQQAALEALEAVTAEKAALEALVAQSTAAHKAHAELKELRIKSKQEMSSLQQELKSAQMMSKGGDKAKQLVGKEMEKQSKKLAEAEAKLRTMTQEKMAAQTERGALDRKVKLLEGSKAKLAKDLEKKDASEGKKREAVMLELKLCKDLQGKMEDKYSKIKAEAATLATDLERTRADLAAATVSLTESQSEHTAAAAALAACEDTCATLEATCEDLRQQATAAAEQQEAQLQEANDQVASLTVQAEGLGVQAEELRSQLERAEGRSTELVQALEDAAAHESELKDSLAQARARGDALERVQEELAAVTGQRAQLEQEVFLAVEMAQRQADDLAAAAAERDSALQQVAAKAEVVAAREATCEQLGAMAREHMDQIQALSADLASCTEQLEEKQTSCQDLVDELSVMVSAKADMEQFVAQIEADLQAQGASHESAMRQVQSEIEAQRSDAAAWKRSSEAANVQLCAAGRSMEAANTQQSERVVKLQSQVDAQKEEIRVLDKEATRARNACTALENEKQRMAAKCDTLEREQHSANQAKHAAEQLLRKAQNQQSIKDFETEALKVKLHDAEVAARQARAALLTAQSPNSDAGGTSLEASVQEGHLQELRMSLDSARGEISSLKAAVLAREADLEQLQSRFQGHEQNLVQADLQASRVQLEERGTELQRLQADLVAKQLRLDSLAKSAEEAAAVGGVAKEACGSLEAELQEAKVQSGKLYKALGAFKQVNMKLESCQQRLGVQLARHHGIKQATFTELSTSIAAEYDVKYAANKARKSRTTGTESLSDITNRA